MLNGSIHCVYGPNQCPNCLNGSGYLISGAHSSLSYLPPTDWPSAGSLLRVPQTVHLSITLPWYSAASRVSSNSVIRAYANEYLRIKTELDSLVVWINALRPNRTWATRVNWISVPSYEESTVADGADTNSPNFSYGNRYLHMLPLPANSNFFGTNHLTIWIGTVSWDFNNPTPPPDTAQRIIGYIYGYQVAGVWTQVHILNDTVVSGTPGYIANCRPCVTTNYGKFAKFSSWLYGMNIDWGQGPAIQMPLWSNQALFDTASDLANYGYEYKGDNSLVSTTNLMPLIASHFGFDPSTGKDL